MGIFSLLFGGKKKSSVGLSPEVSQIFEKIVELMEDENLQNYKVFGVIGVNRDG